MQRKVALRGVLKRQIDYLVSGESIDDGIERSIEENFAVVDNDDAIAKFFNVLHVMTCQHRHNPVFGVVEPKKFAHALLAYDIEADGRFIEKQDPGLVDERRDQFHLHPFSERKLAYHHIHLILDIQKVAQVADHLFETVALDSVDGAIKFQRFLRGKVPPKRVLLSHEQTELTFHFRCAFPRNKTEHARIARGGIEQTRQHLKNGCLAGPVWAQKSDKLAFVYGKGDIVCCADIVIFATNESL